MIRILRVFVMLCACLGSSLSAAAEPDRLAAFPRSTLEIVSPGGRIHKFDIWVAADDRRRMQGLMHVEQMPDNAGMLFIFRAPGPIGMWMKNTVMSLDMVFIGADGRIGRIAANTKPFSLDTINSGFDALGVLELKAGTAARLGIEAGAVVIHPAFSR